MIIGNAEGRKVLNNSISIVSLVTTQLPSAIVRTPAIIITIEYVTKRVCYIS